MSSAAARNRKIATSPALSAESAVKGLSFVPAAFTPAASRPLVGISAPATPSPLRNARRRTTLFQRALTSSLLSWLLSWLFSCTVHSLNAHWVLRPVSRLSSTVPAGLGCLRLDTARGYQPPSNPNSQLPLPLPPPTPPFLPA